MTGGLRDVHVLRCIGLVLHNLRVLGWHLFDNELSTQLACPTRGLHLSKIIITMLGFDAKFHMHHICPPYIEAQQ